MGLLRVGEVVSLTLLPVLRILFLLLGCLSQPDMRPVTLSYCVWFIIFGCCLLETLYLLNKKQMLE